MSATCQQAIRSIRVCAWINIRKAKAARKAGRERLATYHAQVALDCRRDANALR